VFGGATTNERVYTSVVRALIGAAVDGFNGTAFAYGQTSSGKTFTMNGSDADPGIIPRAVRDIFDTARQVLHPHRTTPHGSCLLVSCRGCLCCE
jgi:centromeric protein E